MSKYINSIGSCYKTVLDIAADCAKRRFNSDVALWKGDFEIKDAWYENKKPVGYSVRTIKFFGVCGVSVVVKIKEDIGLGQSVAKFYFGFIKGGKK